MTWTRAELKRAAKGVLKLYYWKMVLVALILASVIQGGSVSTGNLRNLGKNSSSGSLYGTSGSQGQKLQEMFRSEFSGLASQVGGWQTFWKIVFFAVVVVVISALCLRVFALNPLEVGCRGFFAGAVGDVTQEPNLRRIANGFTQGYWNCVVTCFLRDLYVALWSLLFIIPGVVKSYEYRMVPYLLEEYPQMDRRDIFEKSREMMQGNKWDTFVLDLSFIGWEFLCVIPFVNIFWTAPYIFVTQAALYVRLSGKDDGRQTDYDYAWDGFGRREYEQGGADQGSYGQSGYQPGGVDRRSDGYDGYGQTGADANTQGAGRNQQGSGSVFDENYFSDH